VRFGINFIPRPDVGTNPSKQLCDARHAVSIQRRLSDPEIDQALKKSCAGPRRQVEIYRIEALQRQNDRCARIDIGALFPGQSCCHRPIVCDRRCASPYVPCGSVSP